MSVWFITGASRGFGRRLLEAAVAAGDQVVAAARTIEDLQADFAGTEAVLPVALDVTVAAQAVAAVAAGLEKFGRLDVVVNNAGYGIFGSIEETPDAAVRAVFDTNVFGLLNVTRAVLPVLRRQRSGHVLNISSSAGISVAAGRGLYGASKFAVEAITEALHAEMAPLGVAVTAVEPGSFRTGFLSSNSRRQSPVLLEDYEATVGVLLKAIAGNDGKQPGDPDKAVAAIRQVAGSPNPPLRLPLGADTVQLIEGKIELLRTELDRFRDTALLTGF